MKVKDAQEWANFLRSGDYEQGDTYLKEGDNYCCLGVLNDLHLELDLAGGYECSLNNYKKIGLESSVGAIGNTELSILNDNGCYSEDGSWLDKFTFDEIADIIELKYVHKAF